MMTEPKEKTLIQRGDFLFCTECDCAWAIGEDERHDSTCVWYVDTTPEMISASELFGMMDRVGQEIEAFGPDITSGNNPKPIPVVPISGWVCARCQRVFAPYVTECPHCQPGICTIGG